MVGLPWTVRRWLDHKRIAFDTSFLIPLLEDVGEKGEKEDKITRVFDLIEKRSLSLVTSTVTLLEILVHPHRNRDLEMIRTYYGYLPRAPFLQLVPVTIGIADRAAVLRAEYGFKTPHAIQLATALTEEATLFLTRDREFRKQKEIEVGIL